VTISINDQYFSIEADFPTCIRFASQTGYSRSVAAKDVRLSISPLFVFRYFFCYLDAALRNIGVVLQLQ